VSFPRTPSWTSCHRCFARQIADRKPGLLLLETSTPSIALTWRLPAAVKDAVREALSPAWLARHYFDRKRWLKTPAAKALFAGECESVAANLAMALQAGRFFSGVPRLTYAMAAKCAPTQPARCSIQPRVVRAHGMPFPATPHRSTATATVAGIYSGGNRDGN